MDELTLEPASPSHSKRPRALWGALAAVAVAAGALVVTSVGDDGTQRPGLPVTLGSSAGAREALGAADSMLAWVTYVAGDGLPALGGEAPAYRLLSTVTEAQVRALADALGIDGEVVREESGWSVYGDSSSVHVNEGGGSQWWFSPTTMVRPNGSGTSGSGSAGCDGGPDCTAKTIDCGASEDPAECITGECPDGASCAVRHAGTEPCNGAVCVDAPPVTTIACGPGADCVEPVPPIDGDCAVHADGFDPCATEPADLRSEAEARAIALDLLVQTGVAVDDAVVTVDGPYDAWHVSVEPRLAGVPSGRLASVSVGSDGEIVSASGYLAHPERLGVYAMLDTRATIDRANAQAGAGGGPGTPSPGDVGVQTFDSTGTAIGGNDGISATTIPSCRVQPDGSEICETTTVDDPGCANAAEVDAVNRALICEVPTCPQAVPPVGEPLEAPETIDCVPPSPEPELDVGPVEVVLVEAERSLVQLGAVDGSPDAYLVPAYRFTDEGGGTVDLAAVADSELTTPPTTGTSAPDPVEPPVEPQPCEGLVEGDGSGTTHTIQPDPACATLEPQGLEEGEEPQIGVGYYVDVDTTCHAGSFRFAGEIWTIEEGETSDGWSSPHEGGTFTLDAPDHGTFVGDAGARTKVASFGPRAPEAEHGCEPAPRP